MLRGQVWKAALDEAAGPKLYVIVSHNARNKHFDTALGVRVTTTERHSHLPTVVPVLDDETIHGWIPCDSLTEIWDKDLEENEPSGALSQRIMHTLEPALRAALGF